MSWYVPHDVLVQVLKRLPLKSLGRCRCVSRSWNVLISSSEFIHRFHLRYQSNILKNLNSIHRAAYDQTYMAEYSINGDGVEHMEIGCEIQAVYNSYESPPPGMRFKLAGSCNGLICQIMYDKTKFQSILGQYEISLCNPITKSTWKLPKNPSSSLEYERRTRVVFYGFGYDEVHDTYKVFVANGAHHDDFVGCEYLDDLPMDDRYGYEVYSLRSNKWMVVNHDFDDYYIHHGNWVLIGVLINGALHWIIKKRFSPYRNKRSDPYYILAFDLIDDKLTFLAPFPEAVAVAAGADISYSYKLSVMNGCLLLTDTTFRMPEQNVDMWIMKEYGVKDSWTRIRIHSSPYNLCWKTPLALLLVEEDQKRGRLIYHTAAALFSEDMKLLSYDIESHQVVELPPTPHYGPSFAGLDQLPFVPSLVRPHPPPSFGNKKRMAKFGPRSASLKKQKLGGKN